MSGPHLGAPDHRLDNLCVVLDYNGIQLDGFVKKILDLEPVADKWRAFGWTVDEEGILASAGRTGRVATVEDHSVHGGLGSAVAELLGEHLPTPLKRIGVSTFGESGDPKGLYAKHGLDVDGIARATLKFLNR